MRPEDMNTINEDGKAFNGNYFAVRLAMAAIGAGAGCIAAVVIGKFISWLMG